MRYLEPTTLDEAIAALGAEEDARCLAGGATLVAMMNADLVSPSTLIGLRRVTGLAGIEATGAGVRIGAMTTHAAIAADARLAGAMAVVRHAAAQIAHPAIRNQGTIGGSICHADPSADFPGALLAADAAVEARGPGGSRTIPITEFFRDYFETALARDEIVTAVLVPKGPEGAVGHHLKFSRVEGDYATVSISLVLAMDGGTCRHARVAVGSVGPVPLHLDAADAALAGSRLTEGDVARAGALLAEAANPVDDVRGSSEYRRILIPRLLGRALEQARGKLHV
jgi:carbon-monoxide dehydrogenase medium subunit